MTARLLITAAAVLLLGSAAAEAQLLPGSGGLAGLVPRAPGLPPLATLTPPEVRVPVVPALPALPGEPALAGVSRLVLPPPPGAALPPVPAGAARAGTVDLTPHSLTPLVDPDITLIRLPQPCVRLTAIEGRLRCLAAEDPLAVEE